MIKGWYAKDPKAQAYDRKRIELRPWLEEDDVNWEE